MELTFYGAAGGVTGSCFLLQIPGKRVLIDCGLVQGEDDERAANARFAFEPRSIDAVLLTHAHLDHSGRLPLLTVLGFRGEIIATSATRDLARLVLLDAAQLQAEDAKRAARQHHRRGTQAAEPLFDDLDVYDALDRFKRMAEYNKPIRLGEDVRVTFGDAGHILGSAWILVEVGEGRARRRILFSGDLGRRGAPLLRPRAPAPEADTVVIETTYGDRLHKPFGPSVAELRGAILDSVARGGNIVIPTFALERAQELLWCLRDMAARYELPRHVRVFLDSPMAISATRLFGRHTEGLNQETRAAFKRGEDPFAFPQLRFTRDVAESQAINQIGGGAVILAGSGMATGGRVLHHLRHNLWRSESSVVFVGYAARGTLARRIIEGEPEVRIFGEAVRVAARIYTIGGFSAHADRDELADWYSSAGKPDRTLLVHGEDGPRQAFAELLRHRGRSVELPKFQGAYEL